MVLAIVDGDLNIMDWVTRYGSPMSRACRTPFSTAGMNCLGMVPPDHIRQRTRSRRRERAGRSAGYLAELPGTAGPPCRWWPSAAGRCRSRDRRSSVGGIHLHVKPAPSYPPAAPADAARPRPRNTVSFRTVLCSMRMLGFLRGHLVQPTSEIFCSSPRLLAEIASPCIGAGKLGGRRWMWSSPWESCSTESNWTSSTLAIAQMSPGMPAATSTLFLAAQMEQVPHLERLAAVPDEELTVFGHGALVDAEHAEPPHERVDRDLEDVGEDVAGRILRQRERSAAGPSPFRNSGGLPSIGLGRRRAKISRSYSGPAPVRPETKHTGMKCPSRRAFSNGSCSCSGLSS